MEDLRIHADDSMSMDQSGFDADVDEDMIDPNGSLMDQVMDVLHSGGSFTIRGILNSILMCSSNIHVQDCLTSLASQGLVEVVGTNPIRWQLVGGPSKQPTPPKESNLCHSPNPSMQYRVTSANNPFDGDLNSKQGPPRGVSNLDQFENNSFVSARQYSSDVFTSQLGRSHFENNSVSPHDKTGFQKQANIGCPPPPSAELFKSLMSQCKFPSAPVKQAGSNTRNSEPALKNNRGFFNSSASNHFSASTSAEEADNYHPLVGNFGFGSKHSFSNFPQSGTSPPSLMNVSTPPGSKYPDNNFSPRIAHPPSGSSSFGQDNSLPGQAKNNRSIVKGNNAPSIACNFNPSYGQDSFFSQPHGKSFGTLNQEEIRSQKTALREDAGNHFEENRQQSSSFPRPPSAQMFETLVKKGPQSSKPVSSKNQIKKLTELESKVLDFMKQTGKQCDTLQISRGVGLRTKKDVNPSLYRMQTMGLIVKVHDKPPTWKTRPENLSLVTSEVHGSTTTGKRFSTKNANPLGSGITNYPHTFTDDRMQSTSQPINPLGKRTLSLEDRQPQKVVHYEGTPDTHKSLSPSSQPEVQTQALSKVVHSAINQNPVSALNEYAQKNRLDLTFEVINEGRNFNKPPFTIAVVLGGQMYPAATSSNMKDARREACDMALRALLGHNLDPGSPTNQLNLSQPNLSSLNCARTHFDMIAALSQHAFVQLAATIPDKFAGRKVIACIVMKKGAQDPGIVVSLGAGNRCVTGQRLSMEGKVVNDSHAEIVARRSLHRFFYSQLNSFYDGHESIFEKMNNATLLKLKEGISFHLYISTAPCGDGALFTPRLDDVLKEPEAQGHQHSPEFSAKSQGILRTKIEDGEGTIPIDTNEGPQTWDGLLRGERLRTMSCSDKICRWNVVGLQGALLSHFIEPIYLESLTLGYLYDHGHLSRAVCCRLQHKVDLVGELPKPFKINHPLLGRVTAYEATRHTEKTNNMSVNWTTNDTAAEVTDGRTGACLSRTNNSPTPSRICKASLYNLFKEICAKAQRNDLLHSETYREAKERATGFQSAKRLMFECFRKSKYGSWVSKPPEQEMF
ncbi:double-stranded RNA-specific editase Adar-like [Actinia tenebrosa]|uniref:Double-stranded RNA-specific editase Adar-like n=1 Tax=Actinia tenebrosa TaxID=6105 RepID=A0A6P8H4K5_ACTTE|nr:double-stranded RNA-specific editase Adar-like [Actinia tenebrosa]